MGHLFIGPYTNTRKMMILYTECSENYVPNISDNIFKEQLLFFQKKIGSLVLNSSVMYK